MSGIETPAVRSELVERYAVRIEAHLLRLGQGHDPCGHLFAVERLARAARAEWWAVRRGPSRERHGS